MFVRKNQDGTFEGYFMHDDDWGQYDTGRYENCLKEMYDFLRCYRYVEK
jgi:hypothetical protein